jgi:hypothetical protein
MAISGQIIRSVFKRYNMVDEAGLRQVMLQMDISMNTSVEVDIASYLVSLQETLPGRRSSAGRATDS